MAKNIKKTTPSEFRGITLRELITKLESLSNNGKNDTLEVQMCRHDGTIACFDTDDERNITSTGIYHDELFDKDFIGIGFN